MALPPSELNRVKMLAAKYAQGVFVPLGDEHQLLLRAANANPTALDSVVSVLVQLLNNGLLHAGYELSVINWLNDFAKISEHLRAEIAATISKDVLDFHGSDYAEPNLRTNAQKLSETLRVERPSHYFDLCRNILTSNGSIFIIGAGFSYDSYAPLLREMEGIACSTLYDLGVENPRDLYHADERKAWEHISRGWGIFQRHVAFMLLPKEPSDQHVIVAELFHTGHISHIVSFNWDDLVEKAYRNLYNVDIPKVAREGAESDHALWKLHGDINNPEERWVLPFEEGKIFQSLQQIILQTTVPAITIGYREQEQVVRERLFNVFENRGGITKIRPDLPTNPPDTFADNSLMAMKKIKAGIDSAMKSTYPD